MKRNQIIGYLKKILPLIIVFCLLATYAVYYKLSASNLYIASEVIHYNDPQAEQGLAPTGDKLDVSEIKSSVVMSKVVDRMGLTGIYSVDSLISRIEITPVEDADKAARKAAKLEEGEEYIYEPSTFIVSFSATSDEGEAFARTVLNETLDVYFEQFSRKYVNVAPVNNTVANIDKENYDYIEMVELIDTSIEETLNSLYQIMARDYYYKSTKTGASFSDLADDFSYIRQVYVSSLFATIYKYQITKNKTVLISDYTTRIDNNNISCEEETRIVEDVVKVIDAYVTKMRDSGNTNISSEYILDDVHERNVQDYFGDQTVTYDELIYAWRDHNRTKEFAIIDSAYCQYVIDTFSKCTGACLAGECSYSDLTCTQLHNSNYDSIKAEVDTGITNLLNSLNSLYDITIATNDNYNEYLGASYISVLSTASVRESINVTLYTLIAFLFLVVVFAGGAIVLARLGEIINYIFYTDHLTNFGNRAFLDKLLHSMNKKLLDDGTVYCVTDISNIIQINNKYSRNTGDEIIKLFATYLKESFGKTDATFIYNGNGSFVILINDSDYITVEDIMGLFKVRLDDRDENKNVVIEYKVGIAETFKENKTARKLISEAAKNKKDFTSGSEG